MFQKTVKHGFSVFYTNPCAEGPIYIINWLQVNISNNINAI